MVRGDVGRWWLGLSLICCGALVVRLGYLLLLQHPLDLGGDPYQYHHGANLLVEGKGFIDVFPYFADARLAQSAQHPPLHYLVLAVPSALGLDTVFAHQLWTCLIGTATVAVVGLVGRRLAGPRAGLVAAALAAVYPNIWIFDGTLAAETTSLLTVALVLLAAYRLWEFRSVGAAVVLGLGCALAALARAEALLLLPLIVLPLALTQRTLGVRQRVALVVLPGLAAAALLAPWIAHNAARFNHLVLGTSSSFPLALVQANCDDVYYGNLIGYYSFACIPAVPLPRGDETDDAQHFSQVAIEYITANAEQVPFVVLARLGRAWGVYDAVEQVKVEIYVDERHPLLAWSGFGAYYLLVAGAVVGAVVLRRRGIPLSPLVAVVVAVSLAIALTFGQTRYRSSTELVLVLLAAAALNAALADRAPVSCPWRGRTDAGSTTTMAG